MVRPNYVLHSGLLSLITYSAILIVLIIPSENYLSAGLYKKYYQLISLLVIFQSCFGFFQLFLGMQIRNANLDSDSGDVIQGTINPFSFLPGTPMGFGNQMFVINILMLITFLISDYLNRKTLLAIILGLIVITFASVLHITVTWLASLIIISLLFNPNIFNRYFLVLVFIIVLSVWSIYYSQPNNFALFEHYIIEYLSGESLKIVATYDAVFEMPLEYPYSPFIGVGPGQFSSKAGLIGTGQYFGEFNNPTTIPFLPQEIPPPLLNYGYDLWAYTNRPDMVMWINSTMNRTFYSILSIYTELGSIVMLIFIYRLNKVILFFRQKYIFTRSISEKIISVSASVNILFILLIGFFENYYESSQAIFTGLLLIKLQYGYLKFKNQGEITD